VNSIAPTNARMVAMIFPFARAPWQALHWSAGFKTDHRYLHRKDRICRTDIVVNRGSRQRRRSAGGGANSNRGPTIDLPPPQICASTAATAR
jgi:hypothetical protein